MSKSPFFLRKAKESDIQTLITLIKELAHYEKLLEMALATPELLKSNMFGEKSFAEAVLAFEGTEGNEGEPIGMALYFFNFSTFTGRAGLYLEDLYVREQYRGWGIGKALFAWLGKVARERDCPRLDWIVLKWNAPSIKFYKGLGAREQEEWLGMRLEGKALADLENLH